MRKLWISAVLGTSLALGVTSARADGGNAPQPATIDYVAEDMCDECGRLGHHHHHGHHYGVYEGRYPGFNCGCNGSYKFPVPPLYTYHWPGMWEQVLMTDYHSPWRFPPLKPY